MFKKTFFLFLFLIVGYFSQAQLTITTNFREDGVFNIDTMKWIITDTKEGVTVFNFNDELTSFRHITDDVTSTYQIDDWTFDENEVLYEMIITSDIGNQYDFMIDGTNELVIFFYYDENENYRMVRHYIQETFFDE